MNKSHISKLLPSILFFLLIFNLIIAQPQKGEFIEASIGLGQSFPQEDIDVFSNGFSLQGEYVFAFSKWIGVRAYTGLILASSPEVGNIDLQGFKATTNAFLLGGKARFCIPIPYIAPYMELGLGISSGSFETLTPSTNISKNGVLLHVPFSLGIAFGRKHSFELEVSIFSTPSAKQFSSATSIGVSIPIRKRLLLKNEPPD